jgi:hypothetical protein
MPWPEHTYANVFENVVGTDFTAEVAEFENRRQLKRVIDVEPWTPSFRRVRK